MNFFKWIGFILLYPIMSSLVYYVFINLTTLFGVWLISKLNLFFLLFIGGFIQSIIYIILFTGAALYTDFISKSSPKGKVAIFYKLIINLILAFYSFKSVYLVSDIIFGSSKGILLGLSMVPLYIGVIYYTIVHPFIEEEIF